MDQTALPAARRLLTALLYVNCAYGLGILGLLLASIVVPGLLFDALGVRPAAGRNTLELGMRMIMVIGIASVPLASLSRIEGFSASSAASSRETPGGAEATHGL